MSEPTATILHLQRLSTEDGPGIRTTVFFKGCSLHCAWCHNPESIAGGVQVQWYAARCLGCGTCIRHCPEQALSMTESGVVIDRSLCSGCGGCAEVCPANALEALGTTMTVDELLKEVMKDRAFYEGSDGEHRGGVTASGGEPALQAEFIRAFFARLQAAGIHTALDTCGAVGSGVLESLIAVTDLFLFDIKMIDPVLHRQYTGQSNDRILQNYRQLLACLHDMPEKRLWIRTPLIPGATASAENLRAISAFLRENGAEQVERWELCAFNNLCRDKYDRLGMEWMFSQTPLMTANEVQTAEKIAREGYPFPERVNATGVVQPELTRE